MAAEQRKLLEQLMGESMLSAGTASANKQLKITDDKVCHSYLVGSCPHDLFTNTKSDLGPCKNVHLSKLRDEYKEASDEDKKNWGFDFDYMSHLREYISVCDSRIRSSNQRLVKTAEEVRQTNELLAEIAELNEEINAGVVEVQILAEQGEVNMAVQDYFQVTQAFAQREDKEEQLRAIAENSGPSGHQKLQVCEICGAYLSRLDNDRRLADHFFGKMHIGYAKMRKELERMEQETKGRQPPRRVRTHEEDPRDGYGGHRDGYGGRSGGYGGGRGGGWDRNGGVGGGYGRSRGGGRW